MVQYRPEYPLVNNSHKDQIALNAVAVRFPHLRDILQVFAVFCFFGFSWALYRMFWYVPSWLEYLSIWKVLIVASYVMAFALIESAVMTGLVSLFLFLFPSRFIKERFVLIGSSLAALISIAAFLLQRKINLVYRLEIEQIAFYSAAVLALLVGFVLLSGWILARLPRIARFGSPLAERMTIFAYLYTPLGLLGLIVVILRNLIGF